MKTLRPKPLGLMAAFLFIINAAAQTKTSAAPASFVKTTASASTGGSGSGVPGTSLGFTNTLTSCYAQLRDFPRRACQLVKHDCRVPNVTAADACNFCQRGWGVYATERECLDAPGDDFVVAGSGSVDPTTYAAPWLADSSCPSGGRRVNTGGSRSDSCPHNWPDLQLWENSWTWPSGSVPQPGSQVTIPNGVKVLVTGCSFPPGRNTFTSITVPSGSELIFDDAPINLRVGAIRVDGNLRVGSQQCRTSKPISITFVVAPTVPSFNMGIQVSRSGQLDLHGAYFNPTWTRLASTAAPGQNWVSLRDSVNWWQGQLVALPTSIFRDEYNNQNEVMTIQSVSSDGRTVVFTRPLQFYHYGGAEYQTEVVLLSRSVILSGGPSAESSLRGGHVHIMGQGRIEGVMGYRMGQQNVLGAYPFHWHMIGEVAQGVSYVTDSSVYRSFYRCFVVHGTNALLVKQNTGFHIDGHCFYLEDGVEERNWFEANFAGFVHVIGSPAGGVSQSGTLHIQSTDLIQPSDAAASGFYASNPNNVFINNAASGGFSGFTFPTLPRAVGEYAGTNIVPLSRPLGRFDGNTVHSTGYFWIMAGGFYFGGRLWINPQDGNKLYYSSGRWEFNPLDDNGKATTHLLTNNKAWLAQWGVSHWGQRVQVINWEAHDCVRGANVFGVALLKNAWINGRSNNYWALYPDRLYDLAPIAGFQWYDTRVQTVLTNVTFSNFVYQPQLLSMRQGVFYSMVPSDEFKPCHISTSRGVTLKNIDWNALIHNPVMQTGSSRYFNWLDWDGTVTQRFRPTVIASWPRWWQLDDDCYYKQEWNSWVCDWYPWRTVARLDIRIPGYTAQVDTQANIPPTQDNYVGYVAQFGRWNADARTMTITRNEGITGVTGTGGWYVHFNNGVTPYFRIFLTQIPVGTSIMFATRYPPGTQFSIRRNFVWYNQYNSQLTQASSLDQVMASTTGELFFFDGRRLYIKLTDPGDASVDPTFSADGASVPGARYFSLSYDVTATNLNNCPFVQGGQFCSMQADPSNDIPPSLPANYNSWAEPYCADVPPPGTSTCAQQVTWGNCNQAWMTQTGNPHLTSIGGYCAVSCGRCQENDRVCVDRPVPGGLSGGNSCSQLAQLGGCYQWWMKAGNFCGNSCGACNGLGVPCIDMPPTDGTTCAQRKSWGSCSQPWMAAGSFCRASCGACTVPGQQQASGACVDLQPSGGYDCKQQQTWGQCSASWLVQGSFCQATCGVCSTSTTNCGDVPPPGGFSCAQQKEWGKCTQAFMRDGGFCKTTCGFCGSACDDNPPPGGYSCAQQKAWGACTQPWMSQGNFCRNTCGTCGTFSAASSSGPAVPMNGTLEGPGASNGSTFSISFPIASNFISSNVVSGTKGPIQMANDRPVLPSLLPNFTLDQPLVTSASPYKPSGSAFVSAQLVAAESGFPGSGALTGLTAAQDVVQLGWAALDGQDPSDPLAQTPLDRYDYPVDSAPTQVFPPLSQAFEVPTVQPAVYPPLLFQQDSSPSPPYPQPSPSPPYPQPSPTPPHPQPSPTPPHPNPPSPNRVSHKPPTLPPPKPRLPVPSREASPPPSAAKLPSRAPSTQPHSKTPAMTALGGGRPPNAQPRQPSPAKPASPSPAVSSQAGRSLLATDAGQVSSAAPPHGYGSWATKPKGGSTVPLPLDSEFVIASAGAPPPGLLLDSPSAPTTKLWSLNVTLRSVQLCSHNCSLTSLEDSMADAIAMVLPPQPSNNSTAAAEVVELPLCDMCTDSTRGMGGVTCSSFVSWGKCAESWAVENNICDASCMRCVVRDACWDLQPPYSSCQEMLTTFKCTDPFLIQGGWCRQTCGYCSPPDPVELGCVPVVPCTNELPPTETLASVVPSNSTQSGLRNCQQLAAAGGCSSDLVVAGGYCLASCGRCSTIV